MSEFVLIEQQDTQKCYMDLLTLSALPSTLFAQYFFKQTKGNTMAMPANFLDTHSDMDGLRVTDTAKALSCSRATIWRFIRDKKLQVVKISPRITLVKVGSIRALLNGGV